MLKNVLFMPDAAASLISVGKLTDDDLTTIFEEKISILSGFGPSEVMPSEPRSYLLS